MKKKVHEVSMLPPHIHLRCQFYDLSVFFANKMTFHEAPKVGPLSPGVHQGHTVVVSCVGVRVVRSPVGEGQGPIIGAPHKRSLRQDV